MSDTEVSNEQQLRALKTAKVNCNSPQSRSSDQLISLVESLA